MYFPLTFDGYALYSYAQYGYVPPALHSDGLLHTRMHTCLQVNSCQSKGGRRSGGGDRSGRRSSAQQAYEIKVELGGRVT